VVEIESKSGKREYNRGHRVKVQWAFGGVARDWENIPGSSTGQDS
jgi:hypothetical protein